MMKRFAVISMLSLSLAFTASGNFSARAAGQEAVKELTSPFNPETIRTLRGGRDKGKFECNKPPEPMQDLLLNTIYEREDQSASTIDPEAYEAYIEAIDPLRGFEFGITAMANRYVSSDPPRPEIAACVTKWLWIWAKNNALRGEMNKTGEYVRKWALASIATSWVQVQDEPTLDPAKKRKVESWLRGITNEVKRDYAKDTEKRSRQNNHLYWAAWAVMAAGMALDDKVMFDWGLKRAKKGIAEISEDGTLSLEMDRGQRALHYHSFAATPLFMMAETAKLKGIDLYSMNNSALARLAQRILKGIENPSWFAHKAKAKQDLSRVITPSSLVWLEIYARHYDDPKARAWLERLRPLKMSRVGGDATFLYGS